MKFFWKLPDVSDGGRDEGRRINQRASPCNTGVWKDIRAIVSTPSIPQGKHGGRPKAQAHGKRNGDRV